MSPVVRVVVGPEPEQVFVPIEDIPLVLSDLRRSLPELTAELRSKWPVETVCGCPILAGWFLQGWVFLFSHYFLVSAHSTTCATACQDSSPQVLFLTLNLQLSTLSGGWQRFNSWVTYRLRFCFLQTVSHSSLLFRV
jgi:hypothetical protein